MSKMKTVTDPREFVKYWFKSNAQTALKARRNPETFSSMCLDYVRIFAEVRFKHPDTRLKPISETNLKHAFLEYMGAATEYEIAHAFDSLVTTGENLAPLQTWIKAVIGKDSTEDLAVIAHWLWMAKRKGVNKPVKHQIMPVLYGRQGGGKTVALEQLIAPIKEFRLVISMSQLGDDRVFEGLATNFVCLFDELQGIERTDMNTLKKQITATHNSYRKLHTHYILNSPMRCSFIGATNKPISESFSDSTGMRRFWEVTALPKLDWEAIGSIDYVKLWQGIDETKEDGYLLGDTLDKVLEQQQALVNKDDLDEFILQHNIRADETTEGFATVLNCDLFDAYIHWAGRNNITSKLNAIWFGRKLSKRLPYEMAKNKDGILQRAYKINLHNKLSNLKLNS